MNSHATGAINQSKYATLCYEILHSKGGQAQDKAINKTLYSFGSCIIKLVSRTTILLK